MNFLAHLHIAHSCNSSLLGNLLGDFVKGDPSNRYPQHIVNGIRLHRFVDSYTDAHPTMREAKLLFAARQRRFGAIALDVMWDHYLASHWGRYHPHTLAMFCTDTKRSLQTEQRMLTSDNPLPQSYVKMSEKMWQGRWLESYQQLNNIEFALQRMSLRSPRLLPLAECFAPMADNYQQLESLFTNFYPELLNKSREFHLNSGN